MKARARERKCARYRTVASHFCVFMFNCLLGRSPEFRVCSKANSAKKGLCQVQHSKVSLAVIDLLDDIQGLLEVLEGDKSAAFPRFSSVFLGDSTVVEL